eukprot:m.11736 g.11736  ORF g.11736 m.11736 type:complete len:388 (-) comp8954_c0_seq1:167-1330(-)
MAMIFDEDDIYDDHEDQSNFLVAAELYEPLKDDNVTKSKWFAGSIDRAEAERRISDDSVPGNFLVRQKDKSSRTFAHSYLSMSKKKCVHNLIELKTSGEWTVDARPFSARTLDELVGKLQQRLKKWRNLIDPSPQTLQQVKQLWPTILQPEVDRVGAVQRLGGKPPGTFLIRNSSTPDCYALSVKISGHGPASVYNGIIQGSNRGYFLKFTELIAPDLQTLVALMLANPERLKAGGVEQELSLAVQAMRIRQPPTAISGSSADVYDVSDEDDDAVPPRPLPQRPPMTNTATPLTEEEAMLYGDRSEDDDHHDQQLPPPPPLRGALPPTPIEYVDPDIYDETEDVPPVPQRPGLPPRPPTNIPPRPPKNMPPPPETIYDEGDTIYDSD